MLTTAPYRVAQWTTGNVGKSSAQAIATHPALELVGCHASIHAIPAVVAAAPGIVTYTDLPLPVARGVVPV